MRSRPRTRPARSSTQSLSRAQFRRVRSAFADAETGGGYLAAPARRSSRTVYDAVANELVTRGGWTSSRQHGRARRGSSSHMSPARDARRASSRSRSPRRSRAPGGLLPAAAYGRGGVAGLGLLVGLLALLGYALVVSSTNADRLRMKVQRHVAPKKPLREKKEKKPRLQAFAGLFSMTDNAFGRTRLWERLRRLDRARRPATQARRALLHDGGVEHRYRPPADDGRRIRADRARGADRRRAAPGRHCLVQGPATAAGVREPAARPTDRDGGVAEGRPQLQAGSAGDRRRRHRPGRQGVQPRAHGVPARASDGGRARRHGDARRLGEPFVHHHRNRHPAAGRWLARRASSTWSRIPFATGSSSPGRSRR